MNEFSQDLTRTLPAFLDHDVPIYEDCKDGIAGV